MLTTLISSATVPLPSRAWTIARPVRVGTMNPCPPYEEKPFPSPWGRRWPKAGWGGNG